MAEEVKRIVEAISVGDKEIDCIALLDEVMKIHGEGLSGDAKSRIATWFCRKYSGHKTPKLKK